MKQIKENASISLQGRGASESRPILRDQRGPRRIDQWLSWITSREIRTVMKRSNRMHFNFTSF